MPRTSERRKIIQQLEAYIVWKDFFEDWDDIETNEKDDDDNFGFIDQETPEELLQFVYAHRYLEPRNRIPKSRDWVENVLPNYDPVRFRQTLRVSSEGFQEIFETLDRTVSFKQTVRLISFRWSNNSRLLSFASEDLRMVPLSRI